MASQTPIHIITVKQLASATGPAPVGSSYVIQDNQANIQKGLANLFTKLSDYSAIQITPSVTTLTVASANLAKYAAVLQKIATGYTNLSVTGTINASQALSLEGYSTGFLKNLAAPLAVSDSVANILKNAAALNILFSAAALNNTNELSSVSVKGALTAANLKLLENQSFAADVNLNGNLVSGKLSVKDALFVSAQNGKYTQIGDTAGHIESSSAGVQAALGSVGGIYVTGPVAASDLDNFSSAGYAGKVNLSGATISGNLTVAEAGFAHAQKGVYAALSDTVAHLESTAAGMQTAISAASGKIYLTEIGRAHV